MANKFNGTEERSIASSYKKGTSVADLAEDWECSNSTIYAVLDRQGVDRKKKTTTKKVVKKSPTKELKKKEAKKAAPKKKIEKPAVKKIEKAGPPAALIARIIKLHKKGISVQKIAKGLKRSPAFILRVIKLAK